MKNIFLICWKRNPDIDAKYRLAASNLCIEKEETMPYCESFYLLQLALAFDLA